MALNTLLFGLGLVALYYGAEWLVRGASRIARGLGISSLVVGLTIVAFGTSAPELVVSLVAAVENRPDVTVGNILGSNILNILGILGIAAVVRPLAVQMVLLLRETPLMILAMLLVPILAWDGIVSRIDGAFLLVLFVGYILFMLRMARRESPAIEEEYRGFEERRAGRAEPGFRWSHLALVALGSAGLVIGARALVHSGIFFAQAFGISELVVGLTIIAIGTSLPELATSLVASIRKESDIALGNVVGSNIFNSLIILGAAAAVKPLPVSPALLRFEIPVMIGAGVLFLPLAYTRLRLGRLEGAFLLAGYAAFMVVLFWRTTTG
jgi:cation:H+ antiporter